MLGFNRRRFIGGVTGTALATSLPVLDSNANSQQTSTFATRGVVLVPEDLTLTDWPQRARDAGLTTIGIHHQNSPQAVIRCVQSEAGRRLIEQCRRLGLEVEYELHAMKELLSRRLFEHSPTMFRMDDDGHRTPDDNCCVHSKEAIQIICESALAIAEILRPTTSRYYYWGDDGKSWCRCPKCKPLTASDQATIVENAIVAALRKHFDPDATLSHVAYHHTLKPPAQVKPDPNLFVEFAPINRVYDHSIAERDVKLTHNRSSDPKTHGGYLDILKENLAVFGRDNAQVLEYWLDVSRFSSWRRPAKKLPWYPQVFQDDLKAYATLGVKHVTSFAAWIDRRYVETHGVPPLDEYGRILRRGS